ncbi:MAG: hypothetical protein H0V07_15120 [Propionibacteriales bacterium]|nr:hypothetical protein [Propionibacteriales bacterium]
MTPVRSAFGATVVRVADRAALPPGGQPVNLPNLATDETDANGHYPLNLPADFTGAGATEPSTGPVTFNERDNASPDIRYSDPGHRLCGRSGYPGGTPYLLMARA